MATPTILPDLIEVVRTSKGDARVYIDGTEVPWAIARESIDVSVEHDHAPAVRLTLVGRSVHVRDDLLAAADLRHLTPDPADPADPVDSVEIGAEQ